MLEHLGRLPGWRKALLHTLHEENRKLRRELEEARARADRLHADNAKLRQKVETLDPSPYGHLYQAMKEHVELLEGTVEDAAHRLDWQTELVRQWRGIAAKAFRGGFMAARRYHDVEGPLEAHEQAALNDRIDDDWQDFKQQEGLR